MRDPREFAHRLPSAEGAFDCGSQSCVCHGDQALWSHSREGKGLCVGKSVSPWPQDEGGHVRNCSEVPELPGAGVRGAALRRARRTAGRPCAVEQGGGAGSTPGEGRPLTAPGAQPGSGWNPGASGLLLWVFGTSPEAYVEHGVRRRVGISSCASTEVPGKLRPMSSQCSSGNTRGAPSVSQFSCFLRTHSSGLLCHRLLGAVCPQ